MASVPSVKLQRLPEYAYSVSLSSLPAFVNAPVLRDKLIACIFFFVDIPRFFKCWTAGSTGRESSIFYAYTFFEIGLASSFHAA